MVDAMRDVRGSRGTERATSNGASGTASTAPAWRNDRSNQFCGPMIDATWPISSLAEQLVARRDPYVPPRAVGTLPSSWKTGVVIAPPRLVGARPSPSAPPPSCASRTTPRSTPPTRSAVAGRTALRLLPRIRTGRTSWCTTSPSRRRPRRALSRRRRGASARRVRRRRARRPPLSHAASSCAVAPEDPAGYPGAREAVARPHFSSTAKVAGAIDAELESRGYRAVARWPRDDGGPGTPRARPPIGFEFHSANLPLGDGPDDFECTPGAPGSNPRRRAPRLPKAYFPLLAVILPRVDPRLRGRRLVRPIGG